MASPNSAEADKWKSKYFGVLDKFEKKESEWLKAEKLLTAALNRISIIAEGDNPLIDHHLQALRVVLKEKFSLYRIESVISELFDIVTKVEKQPDVKKVSLDALISLLDGIDMPKQSEKRKKFLVKELKNNPAAAEQVVSEIKSLISSSLETDSNEKSKGFFSRIFSKESKAEGLVLLANAVNSLPWPEILKGESKKINKAILSCQSEEEFNEVLQHFNTVIKQWEVGKETASSNSEPELESRASVKEQTSTSEVLKQEYLNQFVSALKSNQPDHEKLQSIELSDSSNEDEPEQIAKAISSLINSSFNTAVSPVVTSNSTQPVIQEVFIQLLEHLVVPVSLLKKADELKTYLAAEENKDWRVVLKKVVHFVNEVRFQEYQEEVGYEDFLQEVTGRLQEMVQFLENENKEIEDNQGKGNKLNQAVVNEVDGMRQGVESAVTLSELQTVVNGRLDAISHYMQQHQLLEKERFGTAKDNLDKMQQKIDLLEKETMDLKVTIVEKNREAMFDALTEIPNRLFYEKRIKEDIARWKRFDTPLSIAMWDVDKFKSINDTYGHSAGDKVLKAIAQILNKRIRETDFLARYGGEEFVMLLPGTVEEETLRLTNELRKAVEDCAFHYNKESVNITISCGISGFRKDDTIEKVFVRADKALYQAKESGRNKCVVAGCRSD